MKFLITFFILLSFLNVGAQNIPFKNVLNFDTAILKFRNDYPQEKVFLQTNKSHYLSGETIWIKAWVTSDGLPSFLSRILYIDIVDLTGKVILKKMFHLDNASSTAADFDIPPNLTSGNYSINAYTLWMKNFPDFIFSKSIYIYQSDYVDKSKNQVKSSKLQLYFFPEGGDLILGIKNRIAFKAVNENNLPTDVKGYITDGSGKKIIDFTSEHDGLGKFDIEITSNQNYTANIENGNGSNFQFKLPTIKDEGINIRVENNNPNKLFILLNRSLINKDKYNIVRVVAQINNQIVSNSILNFEEGLTTVPISKKNLPPGILQITVFNATDYPLAERLTFIENYKIIQPKITIDTFNSKARQKNKFSFNLDSVRLPNLSTLITNASIDNPRNYDNTIASSLLLTSDIRGYISKPGYYFKDKLPTTLKHLDLLLMTNGWRRFDWKKIISNVFDTLHYPVESAITIRGVLKKSDRNEIVGDGHVSFAIRGEDSTSILADAKVTDKGEFLLNDINFKKSASIAYQGTNNKKTGIIVDVDLLPSYIDSLKKSRNISIVNLDTIQLAGSSNSLGNYLNNKVFSTDTMSVNGIKYLGNVSVKGIRKKISVEDSLNIEYASPIFQLGKSIALNENNYYTTIWQLLQQSVPGIDVSGNPYNPIVKFSRYSGLDAISENNSSSFISASGSSDQDFGTMLYEKNGIAYFLNEINVSMDVISSINISDIALIKILKTEAAALGAYGGAIAIYTNKGAVVRNKVYDKGFSKVTREGYAIVKTFFSPDYSMGYNNTPDDRITLHWNPNAKPSKDGKYKISFFNSDSCSKFKLIIQGLDADGKLIYCETIIE
jgi:hypothetical protein